MPEGMSGQTPAEDDIDRQLRELTEGRAGTARYREPSAAERATAAQKAREQAKARVRENRKQARRMARRASRRRAAQVTSAAIAIALLGGAVWFGYQHVRHGGSTVAGSAVQAIDNKPAAISPAASEAVSPPAPTGPGTDPFVSTPADHWPNGAAGITIPAAASHGRFTATEVAAAYATTRNVLIAQDLDPVTLRGGAPTAFEDLLTSQQRQQFIAGLDKPGLDKYGESNSSRWLIASFAPGTTTLIGHVIKVSGTMSARESTDQGRRVLDIDVNYHFVYPVELPHDPAAWTRVVLQVDGFMEFADWQGSGGSLQPWVETQAFRAGVLCGEQDGYMHPDFSISSPSSPGKVQPSGTPVDPYSPKLPSINGCRAITGT